MSRLWSRTLLPWTALAALAFALRLAAVLALQSHVAPFTYEHGEIAKNLLTGRGFVVEFLGQEGPTSQQAPLYPAMLAAAYAALGVESSAAHLAMQVLQCLAGAATALCVVWLTQSLLGSGAPDRTTRSVLPWLAGVAAAVYPPHVYMVTHIQVVPWSTLLLTLLTTICVSPRFAGRASGAVLAGLVAGVMLLFEPIFALATPLAALAFVALGSANGRLVGFRSARARPLMARKTTLIAFMAAVAATVVAPWLWRNRQVHGEWVFVKSTFGYALWQGNNPLSLGTDKVPKPSADSPLAASSLASLNKALWDARHETVYIDDVLLKPTRYREFIGLSEPQRSQLLQARATEFIRDNPGRYLALCATRLRFMMLWDDTNPKTQNYVYRVSSVVWLALFLIGVIVAGNRWRRLWPTWAVFAVLIAFHVLTIASARFRMPLEPLTFPTAAIAATWLLDILLACVRWLLPRANLIPPQADAELA